MASDKKQKKPQLAGRGGVRDQKEQETMHKGHSRSFGDYLHALSKPQRMLKEYVSGNENSWGDKPEGMPNELYAGLSVGADFVADPLNVLGAGLLRQGSKLIPKGFMDGSLLSSARNYKNNHYGNTDGPMLPTRTQKAVIAAVPDTLFSKKGAETYDQKVAAVKKILGTGEWGLNAAYDTVVQALSPMARARYADTGVNTGAQRAVKEQLEIGTPRALEKGYGQATYNNHTIVQENRIGPKAQVLDDIAGQANLVGYTPVKENTISDLLQQTSGTKVVAGKTVSEPSIVSEADAKFIQDHVQGLEGVYKTNFDDVVVKRPQSGPGGNHKNDFIKKSPVPSVVSDIFQKYGGKPTLRELYDSLTKIKAGTQKTKNSFKIKNPSYEHVVENGLWLDGSIVGTAITEGGVNWLAKIDTDGTISFVISDKHDFLDKGYAKYAKAVNKIPGVNISPDINKRSLIAVTPVIQVTIQNLKKNQWKKPTMADAPPSPALYSSIPAPGAPKGKTQKGMLEDFVNTQPTPETLKATQMQNAGAGLLAARAYEDIEND